MGNYYYYANQWRINESYYQIGKVPFTMEGSHFDKIRRLLLFQDYYSIHKQGLNDNYYSIHKKARINIDYYFSIVDEKQNDLILNRNIHYSMHLYQYIKYLFSTFLFVFNKLVLEHKIKNSNIVIDFST